MDVDSCVVQGVIQMYSVVLGLEVLGNPVGFVRGLKTGTVGLFYYPIQVCMCVYVCMYDCVCMCTCVCFLDALHILN